MTTLDSLRAEVATLTAERDRLRADLENALENADLVEGNLRTVISTAGAERDALAARLAQAERVVEAARVWRDQFGKPADTRYPRLAALIAAVDALDGTAGPGEEGSGSG